LEWTTSKAIFRGRENAWDYFQLPLSSVHIFPLNRKAVDGLGEQDICLETRVAGPVKGERRWNESGASEIRLHEPGSYGEDRGNDEENHE